MTWKVKLASEAMLYQPCHCQRLNAAAHADYGFEYSDEEVGEEDVDIENQYYNSKGTSNRRQALQIASTAQPEIN